MARGGSKPGAARNQPPKSGTANTGRQPRKDASPSSAGGVSLDLQQKCLDIFRGALKPSAEDGATLQEIKAHLYNRDFAAAFGKEEYLRVYASRWSPSRALGYLQILHDLGAFLTSRVDEERDGIQINPFRAICIGGGAGGELVALATWLSMITEKTFCRPPEQLYVRLLDIADWSKVVGALENGVKIPPELSKYASQARKDANKALVQPEDVIVDFQQRDALDLSEISVTERVGEANLVTFMFTLNELYSTSMPKTHQLLSAITVTMQPGSHLLVVDSPGSYSNVSINGAKKYPMQWLLDYTLLGPPNEQQKRPCAKWEKLVDDESRWFRLPEGLRYPIELENMRYQIHLYRKVAKISNEAP